MKNIYQESDGVYRIELSNGFRDDGTRDRLVERVYGTEADAIKRRDEMKLLQKKKKEEGLKEQNSGYTLTQVAEMYLNDSKYKRRSPTTVQGYKVLLNNWILPELGDIKIRNIEESDLENLYAKMRKSVNERTNKPLSDTYVMHVHKLIKSIYNYAKKKKWILSNPTDYVLDVPKGKAPEREYYGYEEMLNVFDLLELCNLRFRCAIYLLFNTGLRRGELVGLKWGDLKIISKPVFVKGQRKIKKSFHLMVRREILRVNEKNIIEYDIIEKLSDGLVCKKLKTDKSRRDISVIMDCYDLLMKYKQEQINNGYNITDEDYIFRTLESGKVWDPTYLTKEWYEFISKNKLRKITIHDIRHSHATYLLSVGVPLQDVARRLGHSEPATTLKIYTHSNLVQDEKITDYMEKTFSKVNEKTEYEAFGSQDDETLKDNILSVYSIITGINLTTMDNIYSALDKLMGYSIDAESLPNAVAISRKYLFELDPKLKDVASMIESMSSENLNIFVDTIVSISQGIFYDFKTIENIEKYDSKIEMVKCKVK